jgi:hypothetical protein
MAETNLERWNKIRTKAGADDAFRKRLLADPAAVLREHGVQVPPGFQFRVAQDTDGGTLVLPAEPSAELSDEELDQASGGLMSACYVPPQRY